MGSWPLLVDMMHKDLRRFFRLFKEFDDECSDSCVAG